LFKNLLNFLLFLAAAAPYFGPPAGQIALDGVIENNSGRICITLTNNSEKPLDGVAMIALGSDADLAEIGEFPFRLEARSSSSFRVRSQSAGGSHYRLKIVGPGGALLLYRTAPIRQVSDSSPAIEVDLAPPRGKTPLANQGVPATLGAPPDEPPAEAPEATVRPRLLGSPADPNSYAIFFELRARKPLLRARMTVRAGKFSESKPVSIDPAATLQFQLPGGEAFEKVDYILRDAGGREVVSGSVALDQLMDDDAITVLDVRTHQPSYTIGETAKLTVMLEGRSSSGYRLEVVMRDYNGLKMFVDQRAGDGQTALTPQEFVFILPTEAQRPLIFEYKVFNPETGLLFDSGEFEIPVVDKSL